MLTYVIIQYGPWKDQLFTVDAEWLKRTLSAKIAGIDWKRAAEDVERFLSPTEQQSLSLWSERFFHSRLETLAHTLSLPR